MYPPRSPARQVANFQHIPYGASGHIDSRPTCARRARDCSFLPSVVNPATKRCVYDLLIHSSSCSCEYSRALHAKVSIKMCTLPKLTPQSSVAIAPFCDTTCRAEDGSILPTLERDGERPGHPAASRCPSRSSREHQALTKRSPSAHQALTKRSPSSGCAEPEQSTRSRPLSSLPILCSAHPAPAAVRRALLLRRCQTRGAEGEGRARAERSERAPSAHRARAHRARAHRPRPPVASLAAWMAASLAASLAA